MFAKSKADSWNYRRRKTRKCKGCGATLTTKAGVCNECQSKTPLSEWCRKRGYRWALINNEPYVIIPKAWYINGVWGNHHEPPRVPYIYRTIPEGCLPHGTPVNF